MKTAIFSCLLLLACLPAWAAPGDTLRVRSHDQVVVITDPSKGVNDYPATAHFPTGEKAYRKALLRVEYRCPDDKNCGEWDYLDGIFLRRDGQEYELARMITPYGWRYSKTWFFAWETDITDFLPLLQGDAEIVYRHSGYEKSDDRGWKIRLEFQLIEGPPVRKIFPPVLVYSGQFDYGQSAKPIENGLKPTEMIAPKGATAARFRITQTGHGMDGKENCAEFCGKMRTVRWDGNVVHEQRIWNPCGDNPTGAQAGTWIIPRAGWCPGSLVQPFSMDLPIGKQKKHVLDVDMEAYVNDSAPQANYWIQTVLTPYGPPLTRHDAELMEILAPSTEPMLQLENPACFMAAIRIRNQGREPLYSLDILHAVGNVKGEPYHWDGKLAFGESEIVRFPIAAGADTALFQVWLEDPNGKADAFLGDNRGASRYEPVPAWPQQLVVYLRSNAQPSHNRVQVLDALGYEVWGMKPVQPGTDYRDTLLLQPGCYTFSVEDTAQDGLEFWFNSEGGRGWVRVTDTDGRVVQAWPSDFGAGIRQQFQVGAPVNYVVAQPITGVFPVRAVDQVWLDVYFPTQQAEVTVELTDPEGVVMETRHFHQIREAIWDFYLGQEPEGVYTFTIRAGGETLTRRVRKVAAE